MSDEIVGMPGKDPFHVIFSTLTLRTFEISAAVWGQLTSGRFERVDAALKRQLADAQILTPLDDRAQFATIIQRNRRAIAHTPVLFEVIQPTAACQLACDYCGQSHTKDMLSPADQNVIVDRLRAKLLAKRFERLEIGWFGAEPLLGMKVIRALSPRLIALAAEQGCSYSSKVVTNGFNLTPRLARELQVECGVRRVEITLDGLAVTHDRRRVTKSGAATFDRIHANLLSAARDATIAFDICVRVNVDRDSASSVRQLIRLLASEKLQDRISLYFAPLHDWGNAAAEEAPEQNLFAGMELEWLAEMSALGFQVPLLPSAKPIVCMAVDPQSTLTDAFGQSFNCTEVPLVPKYGVINVYSKGTALQPRASAPSRRLANFLTDVEDDKFACSRCEMLPVCGGACPKQWNDGVVPCPSAKRNLKDRLVLYWAEGVTKGSAALA